nr:hypothetical protein [Tanacetum cinerariifolium]
MTQVKVLMDLVDDELAIGKNHARMKSNDVVKLQALIERKKVIITEDAIRQNCRLDDADGIDCLPNEEIFVELARMGYEKPMVRNVDSPSNFLMYLRFLQVMINAQVDDLSSHNTKYTSPALTQKAFANMRRIGKGFLRVDTPLFDAMLVQQQVQDNVAEVEEDEDDEAYATLTQKVAYLEQDKIAQALEITKLKQRVRGCIQTEGKIAELDVDEDVTLVDVDAEVKMDTNIQGRMAESLAKAYNLDLQHSEKVLRMQDTDETEPAEMEEVLEVVTTAKLMTELKAELNANINWNDVIEQVKRNEKQDNTVMMYQALKRKPVTEAQARKNMMIYLKNMVGFKMNFFKGMTYNEIRPLFEKHYNSNQAFLERVEEEVTVQEKGIEEEGSKRKEQMLNNVRLKVEEESEMLLELLRLVRRQLNEGYVPE